MTSLMAISGEVFYGALREDIGEVLGEVLWETGHATSSPLISPGAFSEEIPTDGSKGRLKDIFKTFLLSSTQGTPRPPQGSPQGSTKHLLKNIQGHQPRRPQAPRQDPFQRPFQGQSLGKSMVTSL